MKTSSLKVALLSGVAALCGASASSGAVVYSQLSGAGLTTSTTTPPTVLEDVNFAATTVQPQELTAMTFGYGVLPATTAQTGAVFVDFYDTVNTASTGSVLSNYLGGFAGTLNITANAGATTALRASAFSNLNTLSTPIFFTDNSIGVVLTFTDSTGGAYSTVLTPLTSVPGTPTVGTSTTGVYRDTNGDGDFQATEFNAVLGNSYLSLTTVSAVPEPTTFALIGGLGAAGLLAACRRGREATA